MVNLNKINLYYLIEIRKKLLLAAWGGVFVILQSPTLASAASTCVDVNDPKVPPCPSKVGNPVQLLAENYYPPAAIVVTDQGGNDFFVSYVMKVLKAQPENPPRILANARPLVGGWNDLMKAIEKEAPNPETATRWKSVIQEFGGQPYVWQQDVFESAVDPSTGLPVLRETNVTREFSEAEGPIYAQMVKWRGYSFDEVAKVAASVCGTQTGSSIAPTGLRTNAFKGGNIEGTMGALCFIGDGALNPIQKSALNKAACGNKDNVITVPTSFLKTEHADEIITTVRRPDRQPPCDFAFMVVNPEAAIQALASRPDESFLGFPNMSENEMREQLGDSDFNYRWLCEEALIHKSKSSPTPGDAKSRNSVTQVHPSLWRTVWKTSIAYASDVLKVEDCVTLSNRDVFNYLNSKPPGYLARVNAIVQEKLKNLKDEVRAKLKTSAAGAWSKCQPEFIDVPTLFTGRIIEGDAQRKADLGRWSSSIFPNPINGTQVSSTFIAPEPGNSALRAAFQKNLKAIGLNLETVQTLALDKQGGNIHCATNLLKYCRPVR